MQRGRTRPISPSVVAGALLFGLPSILAILTLPFQLGFGQLGR
jgi:hypothetical protein